MLGTPTWADLRPLTAFVALSGLPGSGAVHVEYVPSPLAYESRQVRLSAAQYERLVAYVSPLIKHKGRDHQKEARDERATLAQITPPVPHHPDRGDAFSTNEECGFLIEGFHKPPLLMTPYNPPYYNDFMEKFGMEKAKDHYAYVCDIPEELPVKILRVADIAERKGIKVRPINKKKFNSEMIIFKDVYNSAWGKNWGFIPITEEETADMAEKLKLIVIPRLTLIAEKDEQPVGFMGMLPDFNFVLRKMKGKLNPLTIAKAIYYTKKIPDLRLLLLGIKAEYRNKGVDALLFREGFKGRRCRRFQILRSVSATWGISSLSTNSPIPKGR